MRRKSSGIQRFSLIVSSVGEITIQPLHIFKYIQLHFDVLAKLKFSLPADGHSKCCEYREYSKLDNHMLLEIQD